MKLSVRMLSATALVMMLFTACQAPKTNMLRPQPRVMVVLPQRGAVEQTITLPGDLVGYYQSALYAKVTGYLKSISVDKGDRVRAGQVLAVIEVPELDERLAHAQANLEIARLTYQRLQSVWKSDPRLVAREDVDIAYSKFQEAKATDDELRVLVSYTRITAPFNGVITERFMDPGALINAGGQQSATAPMRAAARPGGAVPVVSIARLDRLRIYIYVPQGEVSWIHTGMPATLTVQGFPGRHFTGTVQRFAHALDLSTRTMLTEVDLENPERKLYPGMYANVTLVLQRHPDALRLPVSALGGAESHQVLVVKNGQLDVIPVTTGITNGQFVEIISGLTARDLVVQTFSNGLRAGEKVGFVLAKPGPVFAAD